MERLTEYVFGAVAGKENILITKKKRRKVARDF